MGQPKGCIPWNKDLTKETDERVRINGENTRKTVIEKGSLKGEKNPMFGKHPVVWNTGLTKEMDSRVGKQGCKREENSMFGKNQTLEANYNWKNGSGVYRREALKSYRGICEICKKKEIENNLVVHHINCDFFDNKKDNWLLCHQKCHLGLHKKLRENKANEVKIQ